MGINLETYALSNKRLNDTLDGLGAVRGKNCTIKGVSDIQKDGVDGKRITFEWTGDSGQKQTISIDVYNGKDGVNGIDGKNGKDGKNGTDGINGIDGTNGIGIVQIVKTETIGLVDTYKIVYTDGNTTTFEVTNGKDAEVSEDILRELLGEYIKEHPLEVQTDKTLKIENLPADAKAVGDIVNNLPIEVLDELSDDNGILHYKGNPIKADLIDYYNKEEVDNKIGDMTKLKIENIENLVSAINNLDSRFMQSVTYNNKQIVLTYKNGYKTVIDVSPIIIDTNIEELNNVSIEDTQDGQILQYDASLKKFVNKDTGHLKLLQDAKDYTDTKIEAIQHAEALVVDQKPTYSDGKIVYVEDGETKETSNTNILFYYKDDVSSWKQTIWVEGVEVTMSMGDIDFSPYVNKTHDLVSTFEEEPTDVTKVPTIEWIVGLKDALVGAISKKLNVEDIVDGLTSVETNKPLSANQGKVLKGEINEISERLTPHLENEDIHVTKADKQKWNTIDEKIDITNIDTKIGELSNDKVPSTKAIVDYVEETVDLKQDISTKSTNGSNIHIDDTIEGNAEIIDVKRNLIRYPYINTTMTLSGITFTDNGDGTITATGASEIPSQVIFSCCTRKQPQNQVILQRGTYSFSGSPSGGTGLSYYVQIGMTKDDNFFLLARDYGNGCTFTLEEETQIQVQLVVTNSYAIDGELVFKPIMVKGDKIEPYVQYEGYDIISCGKNLASSKMELGSFEVDGTITTASTCVRSKDFVRVIPNTEYTLSNDMDYACYVYFFDKDKTYINSKSAIEVNAFITPENCRFIKYRSVGFNTENNVNVRYQLEYGNTATTQEPYVFDTVHISPITSKASIKTFEGGTTILSPLDMRVVYSVNEIGNVVAKSLNADTTVSCTQAEYDELKRRCLVDANTTYFITDSIDSSATFMPVVNTLDNADDNHVPTAKAVKDSLKPTVMRRFGTAKTTYTNLGINNYQLLSFPNLTIDTFPAGTGIQKMPYDGYVDISYSICIRDISVPQNNIRVRVVVGGKTIQDDVFTTERNTVYSLKSDCIVEVKAGQSIEIYIGSNIDTNLGVFDASTLSYMSCKYL